MRFIRNTTGAVTVVIGAFIFQIGFSFMTKDVKEAFARKMVDGFREYIPK